uniref:Putative secreted protein n=1 Tax=Ixodes ricinus TaxID=34613 RepID=A0A6B0UN83_IXORI
MPLAVLGTLSTGSIRVSHAQRVEFVGISRVRDIWLALHLRWRESVPHVNHRRVIANLDNAGWDCVNNVRHNLMGLHLRLCGAALKAHAEKQQYINHKWRSYHHHRTPRPAFEKQVPSWP